MGKEEREKGERSYSAVKEKFMLQGVMAKKARAYMDGDGSNGASGGSSDGEGGGEIGMQPSEEFRPLPHIYLSAQLSGGGSGAPTRSVGRSGLVLRGAPFIVRQLPRELVKKEREREREENRDGEWIRTRSVPGQYSTASAYRLIQECPRCFVIGRIRKIFL